MIVRKGIIKLFFHPERGPGGVGHRGLRFQELGVMDEAEGAIVVLEFFPVQVLVITTSFAGQYSFMVLQQVVGIPHSDGKEEKQEQTKTPYQAICRMSQHFGE